MNETNEAERIPYMSQAVAAVRAQSNPINQTPEQVAAEKEKRAAQDAADQVAADEAAQAAKEKT